MDERVADDDCPGDLAHSCDLVNLFHEFLRKRERDVLGGVNEYHDY